MSIEVRCWTQEAVRASGVRVVVGNAPQWLKDEADFVTAPFDEDRVAIAIENSF